METQTGIDIFGAGFKDHAFSSYAELRETAPVMATPLPNGQTLWLVMRYNDAAAMMKDHGRFGNDIASAYSEAELDAVYAQFFQELTPEQAAQFEELDRLFGRILLSLDPPDHSRLRRLVAIPFTPKYIEGLRSRVREIAIELLDDIAARVASGERQFDLIDAFTYPLPLTVIAEMLGIPEADYERFRIWSQAAVTFVPGQPQSQEQNDLLQEFIAYLRQLAAAKLAQPGDDLLSGLVLAEADGDKLSEEELISMMFLLIVAGHETTVNLIANGMLLLFEHPEQRQRLRDEPALLKRAIEEMLRFYGPVEVGLTRWVREDTEFGGAQLKRGQQMMAVLASANHDPERFPDPEIFDITRDPNRHLAFGTGIHACLGATLARLEAEVAFTELLARFPDLELAVPRSECTWRDGTFLRTLTALPVRA
ncbi:MAG: cytochrome P450 [Thermomicrobiales bacterium]|nr:cytochrome P450 [Thermomicrobiales bacterium]